MAHELKLGDIGEFGILKNYLIPALGDLGSTIGDDCAILEMAQDISLVVTSDRGARPLAWSIKGIPTDFSDAGWLAVVASASDLATAGAEPFAITNDIEAPGAMLVDDLKRYAEGVGEACRAFGFRHAGGDLAMSERFTTHCTAIGLLRGSQRVGRHQCRPGEHVVALGEMGAFATAYLQGLRKGCESLSPEQRCTLLRPVPQLQTMRALVHRGLVTAASDSSDGVIGALLNITEASGFGIEVDIESILLPKSVVEEAQANGLSPWNLFFFWGGWQVVATTSRLAELVSCAGSANHVTVLGRVVNRGYGLNAKVGNQLREIRKIRNENFREMGFNSGLANHVRFMLETPVF